MLTTRLTIDYGLETPIVSAGMAFVAGPALAAAVSNSGGLGMLGAGVLPAEALRLVIQQTRALTARGFGVDLIPDISTPEHIAVCAEERVPVVTFFWSLPDERDIGRLHDAGTRVWMQTGQLTEAREAARRGVDAIVVQGAEGGGHNRSEAGIFVLLPAVIEAVGPVPVLAAGGIVDGRSMAAALLLGAAGVWCGTRFLATREADAADEYQKRVLTAGVGSTVRTDLFGPEWPNQPCRVYRNRVVARYPNAAAVTGVGSGESIGVMPILGQPYVMPRFSAALPTRGAQGDFEEMALTMGESAGRIHSLQPAGDVVREMSRHAATVLGQAAAYLCNSHPTPTES